MRSGGVRGANNGILPLRVDGLRYAVGGEALLHGLSFVLDQGPRSIILGPNGAGKSLTLRLCHGLLEPTGGRVGWAVEAQAARRRQAMVFEKPVMLRRSVGANVAYALAVNGTPRRERAAMVEAALQRTGLMALAGRPARALSAGEQKRLALARAWAPRPEVLFLDEPTSNLDPAATKAVEEIIEDIQRSGTKVVMTTHDLAQARRLGGEVLFLHRGRLLEHGPAERFFAGPESPEGQAFVRGELLW
jgi:tungstate transport system ATP-binding protein